MTQRAKIVYRKTEQKGQEDYERKTFIEFLKARVPRSLSGRNRGIKLPKYITFNIKESSTLCLYIQKQKDSNDQLHNPVCENMQTDNAAFEGWAVTLKAWMPERIKKVRLSWDTPSKGNENNPHYHRFLYRCLNFKHDYPWFEIAKANEDEINAFQKKFVSSKLVINTSSKEPDKKSSFENSVEYEFTDQKETTVRNQFIGKFNLAVFNHQLPVGVKDKKEQFFPGGQSAIDLWGVDKTSSSAYIYELKYIDSSKRTKNIKVGIISELYFYSILLRDVIYGKISPKDIERIATKDQKWFYKHCHELKSIHAVMLSNEFHPLISSDKVLSILNESRTLNNVPIIFEKVKYDYKVGSYKISFN